MRIFLILALLALSASAQDKIITEFKVSKVSLGKNGKQIRSTESYPKVIQLEGQESKIQIGSLIVALTSSNTPDGMKVEGKFERGKVKAPFSLLIKKDHDIALIPIDDNSFYELKVKSKPLPPQN